MPFERMLLDAAAKSDYQRAGLVTLVALEGSGYQKPGARMLVFEDGRSVGSVTGGCLEKTVIEKALAAMKRDEEFIFKVDTMSDSDAIFGYGLGCAGCLTLRVEPFRRGNFPPSLEAAFRVNATRVAEVIEGETIQPVRRMVIAGSGNDAAPIAEIARAAGWEVTKADATLRYDSRTVAVLVTHNLLKDLEFARAFAATEMTYIAVVGSRKRFGWLRAELEREGIPTDKLRGPAGLNIGAQTPAEIALSIVAEATSVLATRTIATVILAAGSSTRFGSPKQLAIFEGETLIRRAVGQTILSVRPIVVTGANAEAITTELANEPAEIVHNADWQSGIASSIRTGVKRAEAADAVLILLCDQAAITSKDIATLVEAWERNPTNIIAAEYNGVAGVPAIFPRSHFAELMSLQGDEGARKLIRSSTNVIHIAMENAAIDIDTPSDLAKSLERRSPAAAPGR